MTPLEAAALELEVAWEARRKGHMIRCHHPGADQLMKWP